MKKSTVQVMVEAVIQRNEGNEIDQLVQDMIFTFGLKQEELFEQGGVIYYMNAVIADVQFHVNGRIKKISSEASMVEHFIDLTTFGIACPVCGDGHMNYDPQPNTASTYKLTHLYICDTCPMVMMEWYDKSDSDTVAHGMKTI